MSLFSVKLYAITFVFNSGGRDLSGNKRTNKEQSFDQTFDKYNEALRLSCKMGYPVRVVRYASCNVWKLRFSAFYIYAEVICHYKVSRRMFFCHLASGLTRKNVHLMHQKMVFVMMVYIGSKNAGVRKEFR